MLNANIKFPDTIRTKSHFGYSLSNNAINKRFYKLRVHAKQPHSYELLSNIYKVTGIPFHIAAYHVFNNGAPKSISCSWYGSQNDAFTADDWGYEDDYIEKCISQSNLYRLLQYKYIRKNKIKKRRILTWLKQLLGVVLQIG